MNTKTFTKESIIPIQDGWVIVDKEATPNVGEFGFSEKIIKVLSIPTDGRITMPKVIASIGKKIEGVPLIELYQEDLSEQTKTSFEQLKHLDMKYHSFAVGYEEGYKTSEKKYTEADLVDFLAWFHRNAECISYEETVKNYIKSLQTKVPISVTLEYDIYDDPNWIKDDSKRLTPPILEKLKITNPKTNTIIPKSIEYEK